MRETKRRGHIPAGFAALGNAKFLVLLLTGATVVLALLAAAPLGPSLADAFGGTLAGDHVLKNHPTFAPTDVFDFWREDHPAIAGARAAARWAATLALLQQILFAGGLVAVLGRESPISIPDFVAGARRNFWHNVKCFVIFLLLAGISIGVWIAVARAVSRKAFEDAAPGSAGPVIFRVLVVVVVVALYAVFSLLHDFARAARRSDPAVGALRAYGRARATLSGRWGRAIVIFLFWLLLGSVALAGVIALEWSTPAVSALAIGVHILLQIAVLAIRPIFRVAAWGSYLALYDAGELPPAPVAEIPESSLPPEPAPPPHLTLNEKPLV